MANSLDGPSFCATKFSGSNYTLMPLLPGSGATDPTGLQKIFMASNAAYESVNYIRGLAMPMFDHIGIAHKSWLNSTTLTSGFTNKTYGLLASMGPVAYRIGANANADEVSGHYTGSFWQALTLAGGGRGTPVSSRLSVMPCGTAAVDSISFTTPPNDSTGFYMSDSVNFNGGLTEVLGWQLTLLNLFTPDTACPGPGEVSLGDKIIPFSWLNGPIGVAFSAVQRSGGTNTAEDGDISTLKSIGLNIVSAETSPGDRDGILFALNVLEPDKGSQLTGGLTILNRSWTGQANGVGSGASLVVTQHVPS